MHPEGFMPDRRTAKVRTREAGSGQGCRGQEPGRGEKAGTGLRRPGEICREAVQKPRACMMLGPFQGLLHDGLRQARADPDSQDGTHSPGASLLSPWRPIKTHINRTPDPQSCDVMPTVDLCIGYLYFWGLCPLTE